MPITPPKVKTEYRLYDLDKDGAVDYVERIEDGFLAGSAVVDAGAYRAFDDSGFSWDDGSGSDFELFGCAGVGLAGGYVDSNFDSYLTFGLGLPGVSAGVTEDASNFLTGHGVSVVTPYGVGLGAALPSGDGAVIVGTPGPSYSYGVPISEITDWFASLGTEFSNGTYDQAGRPYDPPSDFFTM